MRLFLILFLVLSTVLATEIKQKVTVGAGPYIQTQPYKGVDNILLVSPVVFFDNSLFYVRWSRVGVYFLGESNDKYSWGFSLTAQPRVYGYKASDIKGMDERKNSLEGGLAFGAKKENSHIEIMLLTDILHNQHSWILQNKIGYDFKIGNFSFYPSLIAIYQSSSFTDYYYGVKKSEELSSAYKYYSPNGGLQIGMQTYINYPITTKLSTLINLRIDRLSNQASNSPIVADNYIYSGLASLIYTFEY